jgi:hypothetical protein
MNYENIKYEFADRVATITPPYFPWWQERPFR